MSPRHARIALISLASLFLTAPAFAQVTIPDRTRVNRNTNRGSDGELHATTDMVIDLSLASTGDWDLPGAQEGKGVYDPDKWAVVFKYTKVTIELGATVTFTNHPSGAPVVWLVDGNAADAGNVVIDGELSLDGANNEMGWHGANTGYAPGGPGGFSSGFGVFQNQSGSAGFGPGGAHWAANGNSADGAGSHATIGGGSSGPTYWSHPDAQRCLPLIGGSGGSPYLRNPFPAGWYAGGAGGGAVLIAARGRITLNGFVHANGGNTYGDNGYGGSGGAIRLIGDQVSGDGSLFANGNAGGGFGRRRIEVRTSLDLPSWIPSAPHSSQGAISTGIATIWPLPANDYKVRIVSINGIPVPAEPVRGHTFPGTDLSLSVGGLSRVVVETSANVLPTAHQVQLRVRRKSGAEHDPTGMNPIIIPHESGVIWTGNVQLPEDISFIQAEVWLRP